MRSAKSALPVRRSSGTRDEGGKVAAETRLWAVRVLFERRAEYRAPLTRNMVELPRGVDGQDSVFYAAIGAS